MCYTYSGRSIDIALATKEVEVVTNRFMEYRSANDKFHEVWMNQAEELAKSLGITPTTPRISSKQLYRSNMPSESISQYYQRVISIPMLGMVYVE